MVTYQHWMQLTVVAVVVVVVEASSAHTDHTIHGITCSRHVHTHNSSQQGECGWMGRRG